MKILDVITNDSIISEIYRICKANSNTYSYKDVISRINAALDRYFELISETSSISPFDDSNRTSEPIETQDLVNGQNKYKFSDFTNEVLGICKLAVLDSNGYEYPLDHIGFNEIESFGNVSGSGGKFDLNILGIPVEWTRFGNYIFLSPCPNYNKSGGLRAYIVRGLNKLRWKSFTADDTTDLITSSSHGLVANDVVIFETDNMLPNGLNADKPYYVISDGLTVDTFKVSTTLGGSAVDITNNGTGNFQFLKVSQELGIPSIHNLFICRYASLPYLIENSLIHKNDIRIDLIKNEEDIKKYFENLDKDIHKRMSFKKRCFK